jgi:hypothetical protein
LTSSGLYTAGPLIGVTDMVEVVDALGVSVTVPIQVIPPPRFLSSPASVARCGQPFRYSDDGAPKAEGTGPLAFHVRGVGGAALPEGVEVNPVTGAFEWTPSSRQVGEHRFELVVSDLGGASAQPLHVRVDCPLEQPSVGCGCHGAAGGSALWVVLSLARALRRRRNARSGVA